MKTLISSEFTENKVLVCISFIFFDEQVVCSSNWIVLIQLDLLDKSVKTIQMLQALISFHFFLYLVEQWDLIFANYNPFKLILGKLRVPWVISNLLDRVSLLWIDLHDVLH